jgi:toxin-antitoxin system PIN domain toxin
VKLLDVNVLVDAFRPDARNHNEAFAAVDLALRGQEPILILPEVAVGFVRVVTHPGVFADPNTPLEAMEALDAWSASRVVAIREAGPGRWAALSSLMAERDFRGNDVHDALLAAAALDLGATLVTSDRGFERFGDLRCQWV